MLLPLIPSAVAAATVAAAVVTAAALVFAGFGLFDYDVTGIRFLQDLLFSHPRKQLFCCHLKGRKRPTRA